MSTSTIPEYPTIKEIFYGAGARMQAPSAASPRSIDSIIAETPKSQVAMMSKKGATIADKGSNYYSMSVVMFAPRTPDQCHTGGDYGSNPGGEVKLHYLINDPTSGNIKCGTILNDNGNDPNTAALPSSIF